MMFVFEVEHPGIKNAMNYLLKENTFDFFEVRGVEIITLTKFEISGILDKDPAGHEAGTEGKASEGLERDQNQKTLRRNYCTWEELRPYVFNIVKGNRKPRCIKVIFSYPAHLTESFHENASALFLNMIYENDGIIFTTATSQRNFTMERKMDDMWEDYIRTLINRHLRA